MRSLVFTVTSVSLGVTAHIVGGGAAPGLRLLVPLGLLIWLCAEAFAGSERHGVSLFAGVVAVQALVHVALLGHGGMAMPTSSGAPMPMPETPRMLAAHMCAGAAVALLMHHAEAGLWRLRRWFTARIRPCRPGLMLRFLVPGDRFVAEGADQRRSGLVLAAALLRRGPPLAV